MDKKRQKEVEKLESIQKEKQEENKLKLDDVLPIPEADVVAKVKAEYDESKALTDSKREIFKRREKLYLGIKDQDNKLYVRLVYATVDSLSALEASDERSVIFAGRKIGMDDYANNINNKAKFDFEQM
jgi:ribonuclease HII